MKRVRYEYLVSYAFSGGCGTSYIVRKDKIDSAEQAQSVGKFIEETNNLKNVGIVNFQLLRKYKIGRHSDDD